MGAASARAAVITDPGFFPAGQSTLINFETDGAGNPITLIDGQRQAMPSNAYAAQGVTFAGVGSQLYWVNDGNAAFDAAQLIGGSPDNSIPSSLCNQFTLTFTTPVRAFGFFIANNRLVDAAGPSFLVKDTGGNVITTVQFGAPFIDGTTSAPNTTADYGFMGYQADTLIGSVTVTKQAAILDDLRFTSVPAPGPLALGAAGGLAMLRRRRR
jgi:MYXO-CTERM domain-containing protein